MESAHAALLLNPSTTSESMTRLPGYRGRGPKHRCNNRVRVDKPRLWRLPFPVYIRVYTVLLLLVRIYRPDTPYLTGDLLS